MTISPIESTSTTRFVFDVRDTFDPVDDSARVYGRGETIYAQDDPAEHVYLIRQGAVKLSVLSKSGKQAVTGILGPGDFFGEGCLVGQAVRAGSATAMKPTRLLAFTRANWSLMLQSHPDLAQRFLTYVLGKNIRIENDLIDHLFNGAEKRLARTLLLLARDTSEGAPRRVLPKVSQEMLAEMVGTTRSRVNIFMNKFRKMGFIEDADGLQINDSLLSVVLHD